MSQEAVNEAAADGACLTCLDAGKVMYPLDPYYHAFVTEHWPVLAAGAPMMSQDGAVPAPGGPMTDPRSREAEAVSQPSRCPYAGKCTGNLKHDLSRRVRQDRFVARVLLLATAAAPFTVVASLLPWWAGSALTLSFAFLTALVGEEIARLSKVMASPLFYLLVVRHDLGQAPGWQQPQS